MKALEVQSEDRKHFIIHHASDRKRTQWILFGSFVILAVCSSVAVAFGHKDVVFKALEILVLAGGGFGGGYAFAVHKYKQKENLDS